MSPSPRPVLHLICQAHLDPVWLWPTRDGCAEAFNTIDSALGRMRENPDMKFTRSSAQIYRWVEESDPAMFEEICRRVNEGRWEPIGGWIEQPDCNLPSTESFFRHGLLGNAYFRSRFGEAGATRIGYNVDSFGHAAGLPQILCHSGLDSYVFMRPQAHEAPHVPDLFWWEADDGSRVLCQRVPGEYCQNPATTADELEALVRARWRGHFSPGFDHGVLWLGIGNHGGGPSREHLARIVSLRTDDTLPELRFSTVAEYLAAIRSSPAAANLPTIRGELQHHARGCYAAWGEIKRLNRQAERGLLLAETLALCAGVEDSRLREAWWALLFNQFHDILAGTCTAQTGPETLHRFGAALHPATELSRRSLQRMARRVATDGQGGNVLFAYNALPWAREAEVTLDTFPRPHGKERVTHLVDALGGKHPIQWLAADANFGPHLMDWGKLCARVPLPACGYATFHLGLAPVPAEVPSAEAAGAECVAPAANPFRLFSVADASDTWAHGVRCFDGPAEEITLGEPELLEQGPLQTLRRQSGRHGASVIVLEVIARGRGAAVEIRLRVDWREPRRILRIEWRPELPGATGAAPSTFVSQTAGGRTPRDTDGEEQPAQSWCALAAGRHAALLVNDGVSSVSSRDGVLSMIVARSAPYAEHAPVSVPDGPATRYLDQGWQERRFWTLALEGEDPLAHADRAAADLLTPAEALIDSMHVGDWPRLRSFFAVEPRCVSLLCLKRAENAEAWIARLQNTSAAAIEAGLQVEGEIAAPVTLAPHQILTLRITPAAPGRPVAWQLVDACERPPALGSMPVDSASPLGKAGQPLAVP